MNIQGNKEQKKILTELLIFIICVIILFFFIYLPLKNKVNNVRSSITQVKDEIKQIKTATGEGLGPEEAKNILAKKLEVLELKFPNREEDIIKKISELANDLGIEILSINPSGKTPLKDFPKVEGKVCNVMPISIDFECDFIKVTSYLNGLVTKLTPLVTVESVALTKAPQGTLLKVKLEINSYILVLENNG